MRSSWDAPRLALVTVLVVAGLSGVAGCYTVLKHPPMAEVTDTSEEPRDCYDCHHTGGSAGAYDPLYTPGFGYYGDSWYPYYAYPWWYREYWYWDQYHHRGDDNAASEGGTPAPAGQNDPRRHLWGRGSSFGPPPGGAPIALPTTPPVSAAPAAPAATKDDGQSGREMKKGDSSAPAQPATPPSNTDKGKDDSKKDDRNVWGRGGKKK